MFTRFALGLDAGKVIGVSFRLGFSRQIIKLFLVVCVLLLYLLQILRRLLVRFEFVSFFLSFLGFLFTQFAGFFLLLHDDFTTRTCTLRQTAGRTHGGKQTNLVGSLAVLFQSVSVRQGQACLRTLHHLLCNLGWNLGDSASGCTFCKRGQQFLVSQFGSLCGGSTDQSICRDTCQLTNKAAAQGDKRTCHIQGSLRKGGSTGGCGVNVEGFASCFLFGCLALDVAAKLLDKGRQCRARKTTNHSTHGASKRTKRGACTSSTKCSGKVRRLFGQSRRNLTDSFASRWQDTALFVGFLDFIKAYLVSVLLGNGFAALQTGTSGFFSRASKRTNSGATGGDQ